MKRRLWLIGPLVFASLMAAAFVRQAQTASLERRLERALVAGQWEAAQQLALTWEQRAPHNLVAHWLAFRTAQRLRDDHAGWPGRDQVCAVSFAQLAPLGVWAAAFTARYPDSPVAWQLRTDALTLENEPDEVLPVAQQCVRLAPRDPYSFLGRAWAYDIRHDTARAIVDVGTAIRIDPGCAWAYADLGVLHLDRREFCLAVAAFQKAVKVDPQSTTSWFFLGLGYMRTGRNAEALDALNRALALGAVSARIYGLRACLLQKQGKLPQALEDLTRGVDCLPNRPLPYLDRARLYHAMKDDARALADANHAIRLEPRLASGYYLRGDIHQALGQQDRASEDWAQYEKLTAGYPHATPPAHSKGAVKP